MPTPLFKRIATVQISTLLVEGLDVSFKVEKSLKLEPNTAEIQVFNLSTVRRRQLQELAAAGAVRVELIAGYVKAPVRVFLGELRNVFSRRDGPDWITYLRSGDGDTAHKFARINEAFAAGTRVDEMIKRSMQSLGAGVGNAIEAMRGGDFNSGWSALTRGITLSGSSTREIEKIFRSLGKEFSIQDGQAQVLDLGKPLAGQVVELTPDTGLVGSPELANDGILKLRALLVPGIAPGRKVSLVSESTRGTFRVETATFTGDTFGQPWYVDAECRRL